MSEPEVTGAPEPAATPPEKKPGVLGSRLFREITGVGVDWRNALLVPLLAIVTALIVSAIIIAVTDIEAAVHEACLACHVPPAQHASWDGPNVEANECNPYLLSGAELERTVNARR